MMNRETGVMGETGEGSKSEVFGTSNSERRTSDRAHRASESAG